MFKVAERLRNVAKKVLDNALPIHKGQVAVFCAGYENLDVAYAFAAECEVRGIETLVQSCGDYINHIKLLEAPLRTFEHVPRIPHTLVRVADWLVMLTGTNFDNSIFRKPELKERVLAVREASKWSNDALLRLCLREKKNVVFFLDPNLEQAKALGESYAKTREMFLDSLDIDYQALTKLGREIISIMDKGGEIHLTDPKGSDLRLHAEGRSWINDDGKPPPAKASVNSYIHNIPVGEVFVAPIEDSAFGVMYPKSFSSGLIDGIKIEFKGKKPATISAEKGFEFMKPRIEKAAGNLYSIAEFAFGTNPCGNVLLATEKAYGTCHVAIGQNTWLGGRNKCSIHWDFLIENPTVTIDDKPILKNGKFIL